MWFDFGLEGELNHPLAVNACEHWTKMGTQSHAPDQFPTNSRAALECLVWLRARLMDHRYIVPDQYCDHISKAMTATVKLVELRDLSATEGEWDRRHGKLLWVAFHPDKWGPAHPWAEVAKYFYQRASDFNDKQPANRFGTELIRAIEVVRGRNNLAPRTWR